MINKYISIILLLAAANLASALEIQTIATGKCNYYSGIITQVDDEQLLLLQLDGSVQTIALAEINKILSFATAINPLAQITLNPQLLSTFKQFKLHDNNKIITAIAYKFIEDIVLLYGIRGHNYVLSRNEISSITDVDPQLAGTNIPLHNKQTINLPLEGYFPQCTHISTSDGITLRAHKILSEKIKINVFLSSYRDGYRQLNDLQERMIFYPVPFLYNDDFRMGLGNGLYFQWATGSQYNAQSLNVININGGKPSIYLPYTLPNNNSLVYQTQFKTHFFHGYFEGNFGALNAGAATLDIDDFNNDNLPTTADVTLNYNYMLFMGADYKNYSLSFGRLYASEQYYLKNEVRSLLADEPYPILRLGYRNARLHAELLYSLPLSKSSYPQDMLEGVTKIGNPNINNCSATIDPKTGGEAATGNFLCKDPNSFKKGAAKQTLEILDELHNKFSYIRANFDYYLNPEITLGMSLIARSNKYSEKVQSYLNTNITNNNKTTGSIFNNSLSTEQLEAIVYYKQDFSAYAGITLYYQLKQTEHSLSLYGDNTSNNPQDTKVGGYFEFIF
jgi:hypothetical protein